MPVLPPSDAAYTRSGYSCASAPKQQSTPRNPVSPRAAHAAGSLPLVIVPAGAITLIGRNTPSLFGMLIDSTDFTAVKLIAALYLHVLLIAPFTWAALPVQSTSIVSPCLRPVQTSLIGTPASIWSSSIQSVNVASPSGSSARQWRVMRSE